MELRDLVAKMSATLLKRRANPYRNPLDRSGRESLADIPPQQRPVYRPSPPVRPASKM